MIELAEEIADVYTYHPLPMYDMTRRIGSKIVSPGYRSKLMMLQNETLHNATKATGKDTIYVKEIPVIANALLGVVDSKVATFSFNGTNAGKIVLSKQLQSAQVSWKYSLDGGSTWKDCFEHSVQLTKEEIDSINITNDIKVHITGLPMTDANIYTIDITKSAKPTGIVINDFEDRMYGTTNAMEWTLDLNGEWTSFATSNPLFNGNKRVYVRTIANGTNLPSDPVYFSFTDSSGQEEKRYIQTKFLSVPEVSGTKDGNKDYIVDGNVKTYWRSVHGKLDDPYIPAYVIIELEDPRYVTALDYVHDSSALVFGAMPYGFAKNVDIYVSMDKINWTKVASKTFADKNNNAQQVVFDEVLQAKYVKFDCKSVYDSAYNSLAIGEITLYEDTTAELTPRAEVNYNIINKTNKDVVAELVNPTRSITVTNNDGKMTHTFDQNGEFTFEFVDKAGNKGTATAVVDWIDKEPPIAEVTFNTTELTNENVVATLTFDKKVTILSEDVQVSENPVDKSQTITFLENNTFELKFADELGNIGTKIITVDWIDTEVPTAEFEFNTIHLTDGEVIATLKPSEEVTVTNNGGNDTYTFTKNGSFTFEFVDMAGNAGEATVTVDWISKPPKYEIHYSTKEITKENVTVTLDLEAGYRIFNNNAKNEYVFENSGTFEFQYKDANGYDGIIPVTVDWIDKEAPTAEFEFSTQSWTNQDVVVTLKPSEEVTVTNNGGKFTYIFTDNGEFTFELVDKVGNKGSATVSVYWIDRVAPTATIEYSTRSYTEGPVVATLKPSKEVTILGNGEFTYTFYENAEFTFEFVDRAGNKGFATAVVDWIAKKIYDDSNYNPGNNTGGLTGADRPNNDVDDSEPTEPSIPENTYKEVSNEEIAIKVPDSIMTKYDNVSLDYQQLTLSDAQKNRYGEDSEIYEVSLKTKDNEEIDLSDEMIEQIIKLNPNKKFNAIYVVRPDGSVVKLNCKVNKDNELIFTDKGLGKYIVSYKTVDSDKEEVNNNGSLESDVSKDKKSNYLFITVGAVSVLLIGGTSYFRIRRRNHY